MARSDLIKCKITISSSRPCIPQQRYCSIKWLFLSFPSRSTRSWAADSSLTLVIVTIPCMGCFWYDTCGDMCQIVIMDWREKDNNKKKSCESFGCFQHGTQMPCKLRGCMELIYINIQRLFLMCCFDVTINVLFRIMHLKYSCVISHVCQLLFPLVYDAMSADKLVTQTTSGNKTAKGRSTWCEILTCVQKHKHIY